VKKILTAQRSDDVAIQRGAGDAVGGYGESGSAFGCRRCAAVCMFKVHDASAPGPVIAANGPQAPEEFTPQQLTYELFGSIGDGMLS